MLPVPVLLVCALAAPCAAQQEEHWAFVAPRKAVPAVVDAAWCRDDIDRCVLAGLERDGLRPSPAADRAVLLRRLHLVLTGLPPSPAEVDAFVADAEPEAYARRVDALLASTAAAEHQATAWLDLARFADTYGYQADFECRTWPWRDWLIRSFHADKPWDRFVAEITAGDLLPDATLETRTATAFWRLHRQTNEGGSIEEEWRQEYIADRVDTLGTAFLGLTLSCARCHDHKSDPITMRDYYSLGSFFAIDESGLVPYSTGGVPQPAVRLSTAQQDAEIARLRAAVAVAEAACAAAPADAPPAAIEPVARRDGLLECDGDARHGVKDVPKFTRADPFRIDFDIWCPDHKQRAVVLHTCRYTLDADTQGYQVLIRDGRLCWELVHHWPGSAIALRTVEELPLRQWLEVSVTYDGSSRAAGLCIRIDGDIVATEVVRDHLAGPTPQRAFELGARDRDRGFKGGKIRDLRVFVEPLVGSGKALREARAALHAYVDAIPELMVMAPHSAPPARFVLRRGAYEDPDHDQPVSPGVPAAVLPFDAAWPRDRRGLAAWLNDRDNPLTARVVVDRLWAQCFGRGLVATPDNFGLLAARPRQQALLDLLASDFASQRSVRAILRRIVLSSTFRQSSTVAAEQRAADPDNARLGRGPSFRLSAEALRDQALAASGLLHAVLGGPSCKPWQPPGLWRDSGASWGGADYKPDQGPNAHRRSLYSYRKRTSPPPNMTVLDAPSREFCTAVRMETGTPLQALTFFNDPVFHECATALAKLALADVEADGDARLRFVFRRLAARAPTPAEVTALRPLLAVADEQQALTLIASTVMASDAAVVLR